MAAFLDVGYLRQVSFLFILLLLPFLVSLCLGDMVQGLSCCYVYTVFQAGLVLLCLRLAVHALKP